MADWSRRRFLIGASAAAVAPLSWADRPRDSRILVVVELSGGNDGLNTIVPHGDDAYYRQRPNLGIRRERLLPLDDHFGFNPGAVGLERLWRRGDLAIVHGVGYEQPSYSHFTSMAYWHTGAPHGGAKLGWLGRLADAMDPAGDPNFLVNIGSAQSLAVKARGHAPVVFDDPVRFRRDSFAGEGDLLERLIAGSPRGEGNSSRAFLHQVAASARAASRHIREAWQGYRTPVDYGIAPMDLPKVAACIASGFPARLYYVSMRNNAFDTHVQQAALHERLLSYAADGLYAFVRDLERLGLGERVSVMVFSEFGRRVAENANLGTDHGSANVLLFAGRPVRGGHYGDPPSLTELNPEGNLVHGVDFRRAYATAIDGWLRTAAAGRVLGGTFAPLPVFGSV